MTGPAPRIETERLVLDAHRSDDVEEYAAMWGDAAFARFIKGRTLPRDDVWGKLLRCVGHWSLAGWGPWVVRDRSTSRLIGEAGFGDWKRAIDPPLDAPEAGWMFVAEAHGRGLATEAMRAALAWLDAHVGPRSVCMIDPDHAGSIRVAHKCGYRERARTKFKGEAVLLLERVARP